MSMQAAASFNQHPDSEVGADRFQAFRSLANKAFRADGYKTQLVAMTKHINSLASPDRLICDELQNLIAYEDAKRVCDRKTTLTKVIIAKLDWVA